MLFLDCSNVNSPWGPESAISSGGWTSIPQRGAQTKSNRIAERAIRRFLSPTVSGRWKLSAAIASTRLEVSYQAEKDARGGY